MILLVLRRRSLPPGDVYADDDFSPSWTTGAKCNEIMHDDGDIMDVTDRNENEWANDVIPNSKCMKILNIHLSFIKWNNLELYVASTI